MNNSEPPGQRPLASHKIQNLPATLLTWLVFWLGFVLVLPQALWVRKNAVRTPAASGPRSGQWGHRPALNLLGLGDSIIDGAGVAHTHQALTAQIARAFTERGYPTRWTGLGKSGLTSRQISRLLTQPPPQPPDIVVISAGVNDVTGLTRRRRLLEAMETIADSLCTHCPTAHVVLLGVPPMERFPGLPQPLRWVIGQRARLVHRWGQIAAQRAGWQFLPCELKPRAEDFADDGYHPNRRSVRRWARAISDQIPLPQNGPSRR